MKWLEIIELRTLSSDRELLKSQLQELIIEMSREVKNQTIRSYFRAKVDTDFSIHLFHNSEAVAIGGSQLGLRLVSALRDFGLVDHSIWIETYGE